MGGVINSVLKSGSNEFHGSVFSYWSPYWFASDPNAVTTVGGSLGFVRKPDYDTSIGVEVGGPIIKDRLFFWAGFAPRFQNSHVFRQTYVQLYDPATGGAATDANGNPISIENTNWRARIPESRQTYFYGATLDFIPSGPQADPRAVRLPRRQRTDAFVQPHRAHLQPRLGPGEVEQDQHRPHRALDLEADGPPLADRRHRGHALRSTSTTALPIPPSTM